MEHPWLQSKLRSGLLPRFRSATYIYIDLKNLRYIHIYIYINKLKGLSLMYIFLMSSGNVV